MKNALLVVFAGLVMACTPMEAQPEPDMKVTLGTLLTGEDPFLSQEAIGRVIVMVARGWDSWPGYYTIDEINKVQGITAEELWNDQLKKQKVHP